MRALLSRLTDRSPRLTRALSAGRCAPRAPTTPFRVDKPPPNNLTPDRAKREIIKAAGTRASMVAALAVAIAFTAAATTHRRAQTRGGPHIPAGEERMKGSASFQKIPPDLVVRLRVVAQKKQRYDTEGDWLWDADTLEIRISREVGEQDPRYATLLFVHELIEALLCRSAGITGAQVDAFDMSHQQEGEPGDNPAAPYHRQHAAAEAAERALANQLGINWDEYLGR